MYNAEIQINNQDLIKVLSAEKNKKMQRSELIINKNKISIKAKDIIAFKATINSIIKIFEAYENTASSLK